MPVLHGYGTSKYEKWKRSSDQTRRHYFFNAHYKLKSRIQSKLELIRNILAVLDTCKHETIWLKMAKEPWRYHVFQVSRADKTREIKSMVGSESPCGAELPSADLHSLFFQIHPRWRFFINNFYLISSHRLKSISGTIIIIVNNNNFDFIAILLLAGGLKITAEWTKVSVDFYWKFERSTSEFGKHSEN